MKRRLGRESPNQTLSAGTEADLVGMREQKGRGATVPSIAPLQRLPSELNTHVRCVSRQPGLPPFLRDICRSTAIATTAEPLAKSNDVWGSKPFIRLAAGGILACTILACIAPFAPPRERKVSCENRPALFAIAPCQQPVAGAIAATVVFVAGLFSIPALPEPPAPPTTGLNCYVLPGNSTTRMAAERRSSTTEHLAMPNASIATEAMEAIGCTRFAHTR